MTTALNGHYASGGQPTILIGRLKVSVRDLTGELLTTVFTDASLTGDRSHAGQLHSWGHTFDIFAPRRQPWHTPLFVMQRAV